MVRIQLARYASLALVLVTPAAAPAADDSELRALRAELEQVRQESREEIEVLEARVRSAEDVARAALARAERADEGPPPAVPAVGAGPSSLNALNPAIGFVLDGKYRAFKHGPEDPGIPGFALGDEAGPGLEGLSLGESELRFDANIDDRFYGAVTIALVEEDGETEVELENAFVQTLGLPQSFTLRAGRFFSGIGYLNERHLHTDDFADRPLLYRALLDDQYTDDGVQLRWLAPTDTFLELGGELLRGSSFPAGGNEGSGKGTWSLFAHAGGDVGYSHSWRAGLSYLVSEARDRETGEGDVFSGSSRLWLADFVWKWAPDGNPYRRNFKLQGELGWGEQDGRFTPSGGGPLRLSTDQLGWYLQGIYQWMPRWRAGLRYGELHADDPGAAFAGSVLDRMGHTPRQITAMVDWSNSEFSRVRLQYSRDRSAPRSNDRWTLQYQMSLGAHGAHQF